MNGRAFRGDENGTNRQATVRRYRRFLSGPRTQDPMTSGMTAFMAAVGGTSLVCYLLMNRVQNRQSERNSAGGDASGTSSSGSSGGDACCDTALRVGGSRNGYGRNGQCGGGAERHHSLLHGLTFLVGSGRQVCPGKSSTFRLNDQ